MLIEDDRMNDYMAGMIARSEHQHRIQSLQTVRDFDVRSQQPRQITNTIAKLFQAAGSALTSVRTSINREQPMVHSKTIKTAVDNC
jgi:hypothetical protein